MSTKGPVVSEADREKLRRALYGYQRLCQINAEGLLDKGELNGRSRLRMIRHWQNEQTMTTDLLQRLCGENFEGAEEEYKALTGE